MRKPDPTAATTIDIVQRYDDAFNKVDVDGVMEPRPMIAWSKRQYLSRTGPGPCGKIASSLRLA